MLFDQPVAGRSTVSKLLGHRGRRSRLGTSQIRALAEDLTCATNRAGRAADLRHSAEERLSQTHHEDLLSLLRQPLTYAAQNMILEHLPHAVQAEEAARELLAGLLAADFRITPPRTSPTRTRPTCTAGAPPAWSAGSSPGWSTPGRRSTKSRGSPSICARSPRPTRRKTTGSSRNS
ncbi:hypothetical protein ACFQV4_14940 [Streptomyces thermocarboxydus]